MGVRVAKNTNNDQICEKGFEHNFSTRQVETWLRSELQPEYVSSIIKLS